MIDVQELSCQEFVELVTAYFEAALEPADLRRFEEHLSGCGKCGQYLEQMQQTLRVTGALTLEDLPEGAEAALLEAFRGWYRS